MQPKAFYLILLASFVSALLFNTGLRAITDWEFGILGLLSFPFVFFPLGWWWGKRRYPLNPAPASGTGKSAVRAGGSKETDGPAMNADRLELLEKLFRLKSNGAITEDEFRAEKAKVLGVGERSEADVPETRPSAKRRWRTPVLLAAFAASGLLAAMAATGTRESGGTLFSRPIPDKAGTPVEAPAVTKWWSDTTKQSGKPNIVQLYVRDKSVDESVRDSVIEWIRSGKDPEEYAKKLLDMRYVPKITKDEYEKKVEQKNWTERTTDEKEALERFAKFVRETLPRYPGCDAPDIVLSNGQRWAACNVGAKKAYAGQAYPSGDEPTPVQKEYLGAYFQWGRNDDVTSGSSTAVLAAEGTTAWGVWHFHFITSDDWPFSWILSQNDDLWWWSWADLSKGTYQEGSATQKKAMRGPCADGYHVPTKLEWIKAIRTINPTLAISPYWQNDTSVAETLKLPFSGRRDDTNSNYVGQWTIWCYWSSSASDSWGLVPREQNAFNVCISAGEIIPSGAGSSRWTWLSVRCLAN